MPKTLNLQLGPEDLFFLAGIAAVIYGVHLLSRPAAFITAGCILIALSTLIVLRAAFALRKKKN